jgi:dTDP-glucose pyrophosphorylase
MNNWREVLITSNTSLRETLSVIDKGALQLAIVIDEDEKLIGLVTDGDIRRGLIKGMSLDNETVLEVMNKTPKSVGMCDSKAQRIAIMEKHQFYQLPILDSDRKIVGLETLQALYKKPNLKNPVFLMAGGFGRRLRPLTDTCPKPLLKVGGKPILETIIENFASAGFKTFYISVYYLAEQIKDYFSDGQGWGVDIKYIEEHEPLGTAGAVGLLPDNLIQLPLIVMNADVLTQINFSQLLEHHNEQQAEATLCVREYEYQIPYGVVRQEDQRVIDIIEKPVHNCFSNAGVYVLNPSLIKKIRQQGRCDMPDLFNQQIEKGAKVSTFPISEYWMDIGREADFARAQGEFAKFF